MTATQIARTASRIARKIATTEARTSETREHLTNLSKLTRRAGSMREREAQLSTWTREWLIYRATQYYGKLQARFSKVEMVEMILDAEYTRQRGTR